MIYPEAGLFIGNDNLNKRVRMADDIVFINFEEGVKRMMNNPAFYIKMLKKFKDDKSLSEVEEAIATKDMEKAKIAAHTFKGLVGNLSLTELYVQSQKLEAQIKAEMPDPNHLEMFEIVKKINAQTLIEVERIIAENE
jgi:HPt (histidine-containing phosphotransfer) domain-containing protein